MPGLAIIMGWGPAWTPIWGLGAGGADMRGAPGLAGPALGMFIPGIGPGLGTAGWAGHLGWALIWAGVKNLWGWGMVGMKYPPIPICCIPPICCILIPAMRWMYWLAR